MSGLFSTPKMPKPQELPKTPTVDEAQRNRIEADRLRKRRGRAATILSTNESQTTGSVGTAALLGG